MDNTMNRIQNIHNKKSFTMKKLTISAILLAALTFSAPNLFATENGNNNSKNNAKETKEILKFSAHDFTGTEDSDMATFETLPVSGQLSDENNSGSVEKLRDKSQSEIVQKNSAK